MDLVNGVVHQRRQPLANALEALPRPHRAAHRHTTSLLHTGRRLGHPLDSPLLNEVCIPLLLKLTVHWQIRLFTVARLYACLISLAGRGIRARCGLMNLRIGGHRLGI